MIEVKVNYSFEHLKLKEAGFENIAEVYRRKCTVCRQTALLILYKNIFI